MKPGALLVVQPSADYAGQVRRHCNDAVLLASPTRAVELTGQPDVIAADIDDPQAALRAIRRWLDASGRGLGGIVCFVCQYLPLTAYLAEYLQLRFHHPDTVTRTRRKDLTAAAWHAAGVPAPATAAVDTVDQAVDFARRHPPPWILKPCTGSGSEWVLRANDEDELRAACHRLEASLPAPAPAAPAAARYLVQRCVRGSEFGADLYIDAGRLQILRLTAKSMLQEPGLAGLVGAYYVPRLDLATRSLLADTFLAGCTALGITRGLAMVDVILAGDTPYLLEMAVRPGGDCLPELCRRTLGYDPVYAACRIALGESPVVSPPVNAEPLAAMHLLTDRGGVVRSLDFSRLLAHPRVVRLLEIYHPPGDELHCWEGSYDDRIVAAVLVRYTDPQELANLGAELTPLIDLQLEDRPVAAAPSTDVKD